MTSRNTLLGSALVATALVFGVSSSFAQASAGGGGRGAEMKKKFDEADVNHDGKLTKDEVKGKMPMIEQHFDEIDTAHSGAISLKDITTYMRAQRGAKQPG